MYHMKTPSQSGMLTTTITEILTITIQHQEQQIINKKMGGVVY